MQYHLRYYSLIFAVEVSRWTPLKYVLLVFADARLKWKGLSVMLQIVFTNAKSFIALALQSSEAFFAKKRDLN
jgi:hypothetical protein